MAYSVVPRQQGRVSLQWKKWLKASDPAPYKGCIIFLLTMYQLFHSILEHCRRNVEDSSACVWGLVRRGEDLVVEVSERRNVAVVMSSLVQQIILLCRSVHLYLDHDTHCGFVNEALPMSPSGSGDQFCSETHWNKETISHFYLFPRCMVVMIPYLTYGATYLWMQQSSRVDDIFLCQIRLPILNEKKHYHFSCQMTLTRSLPLQYRVPLLWNCLSSLASWRCVKKSGTEATKWMKSQMCALRGRTTLRLGVMMVFVNQMLLMMAGDVERNPGPGNLTKGDLCAVLEAIFSIRAKWYYIGLALKISHGNLDAIKLGQQNPEGCLTEVLKEWLSNTSPPPTWSDLVQALSSELVREKAVANHIREQHCYQDEEKATDQEAGHGTVVTDRNEQANGLESALRKEQLQEPAYMPLAPYVGQTAAEACLTDVPPTDYTQLDHSATHLTTLDYRAQPLNTLNDEEHEMTDFVDTQIDTETGELVLEDELKSPPKKWDAGCPLLDACVRGDYEQVRQLLSHEDELNRTDSSGKTPLHYACQFGWIDIAQTLIQKTPNPHSIDTKGNSILHIACHYGNSNIVDFILSLHICDVNKVNANGNTPLHLACRYGSVSIAIKLVKTGKIDFKVKNNDGKSALEVADESNPVKNILRSCIQKTEVPFTPTRRVYLLGSTSSGKTTLINGLKKRLGVDMAGELPVIFRRNKGIIPISIQSQEPHHLVVIYKFPGNHSFYLNAMPKCISDSPHLFIITVDISLDDAKVEEDIIFWMSQIRNLFPQNSAQMIVIATHPDATDSFTLRGRLQMISSLFKSCYCLSAHLQNTSSPEFQCLLIQLLQRIDSVSHRKIAYPVAVLSSLIHDVFGTDESVDVTEVMSYIRNNDDVPLPESREDLDQLLHSLCQYSDIIYLSNLNRQSWVIVNVLRYLESLLESSRVHSFSELEVSFLSYLGFHVDAIGDANRLAVHEEEHLPTYEEVEHTATSQGHTSSRHTSSSMLLYDQATEYMTRNPERLPQYNEVVQVTSSAEVQTTSGSLSDISLVDDTRHSQDLSSESTSSGSGDTVRLQARELEREGVRGSGTETASLNAPRGVMAETNAKFRCVLVSFTVITSLASYLFFSAPGRKIANHVIYLTFFARTSEPRVILVGNYIASIFNFFVILSSIISFFSPESTVIALVVVYIICGLLFLPVFLYMIRDCFC